MPKNKKNKKSKSSDNEKEKTISRHICFSFSHSLDRCVEIKNKNFFFTNRVPLKQIREYRAIIDKTFHDWSTKTIEQLGQGEVCYPVKINEVRNGIVKVFRFVGYKDEWTKQNIQDLDIYKFKITKQIRMFGVVKRNVVHVLLYDIWHLIDPDKDKNFPILDNRACT